MRNQKYVSKRQQDIERDNKHPICKHDRDHWCGYCVMAGTLVDLRKEGLGRGHIITNVNPPPDNPNGSNRTASNIYK